MRSLVDVEDTAVTGQTAGVPAARVGTVTAVELVAPAVAEADDDPADWRQTGLHDALVGPDGAQDVSAACAKPARDQEEAVRRAAATISAWTDGAVR
ncbi:hypothetical protein [Streptomyces venezuelae]|uniref:hypothetical protein n=1 Tax=Streptomyces venezuelae TaxID=54571 RepID=UPI003317B022